MLFKGPLGGRKRTPSWLQGRPCASRILQKCLNQKALTSCVTQALLCSAMRIALYARVSTTDQSCDMQLQELRHYAAQRGWQVFDEYVDTGWSGK